jgi:hypothetical protein
MLNGLRKEPQVAITLNLNKQLSPNGFFIPQEIQVNLVHINANNKKTAEANAATNNNYEPLDYHQFEQNLGNIITLNKNSVHQNITQQPLTTITIPKTHQASNDIIELHTKVIVFEDCIITRNDATITTPIIISRPDKNPLSPGTKLSFHYNISKMPGIEYEVV